MRCPCTWFAPRAEGSRKAASACEAIASTGPGAWPRASCSRRPRRSNCLRVFALAGVLEKGAAFFVDYGFPEKEFYHPQRKDGTLMCHYRHHAHADPFFLPGLQDITSHVDFSAIATSARSGGLELLGYTGQAQFLVNCGITEVMSRTPPEDGTRFLPFANQANRLMSPAEMGELFKVIALGRGFAALLLGFREGDRRQAL